MTNTHIHHMQKGKFDIPAQKAIEELGKELAIRIDNLVTEIAMDEIILPETAEECEECEEFALESEDAFSAYLISEVLRIIRKEIR